MIEFSLDSANATGTLVLSGSLTIQHAQPLQSALIKAVGESNKRMVINLEQVESIDLTALQLLYATHRDLKNMGKVFDVVGVIPDIVRQTVRDAGFLGCMDDGDNIRLWTGEEN